MNLKGLGSYIVARLKEPTTWAGILSLLTAAGVAVNPDLWKEITLIGTSLAGTVAIILPEGQ